MAKLNINWLQYHLEKAKAGYYEHSSKVISVVLQELEKGDALSNDAKAYLVEALRKIVEGQSPNRAFYFEFDKNNKSKKDNFMRDYWLAWEVQQQMVKGASLDNACEYVANNIMPAMSDSKLRKAYSYFAEVFEENSDFPAEL